MILLFVGCSPPPSERWIELFPALHTPIYEVYELERDPDLVWEHLAASFYGEQLTREYVEHYATLHRMQREQTAIEVQEVDYLELRPLSDNRVDARWTVRGEVAHQGHRHVRLNAYEAIYRLAFTPRGPRIVQSSLRDLERLPEVASAGDQPTHLRPQDLLSAGASDDSGEP